MESELWGRLFLDLSVRVEWLTQALEGVPSDEAGAARLRDYARSLAELHGALERVDAHRSDPRLAPLFTLEGPLAGYLSRLYAWCDEIGEDLERMAAALRRGQPTSVVFSFHAVTRSYAHFDEMVGSIRRRLCVERVCPRFDQHLEELIWANEWLHMTLARAPGA
jgi:hypothetical protein